MTTQIGSRAERLLSTLDENGVDGILVTKLVNVRYLTGYTGSNGLVLLEAGRRLFVTDFRYTEQAQDEVDASFEQLTVMQELTNELPGLLREGRQRLGFEEAHTSVREYRRLRELLPEQVELAPVSGLVEQLRLVKDDDEIATIRTAAELADASLQALLERGITGRTERELAIALEHDMRLRGAEAASFPSIVASAEHGAMPHAEPRDVRLERGRLVTFDWGAIYAGYCSDCTRTVAAGADPEPAAREAYELVRAAQQHGIGLVRTGGDGRQIDRDVRDIIDAAGHQAHYGHGLGHGVGLEIHEAPRLSKLSSDTLAASSIVTVEPGVYIPGRFGIRIEDLVVVRDDGAEVLTSLPKDLLVVD